MVINKTGAGHRRLGRGQIRATYEDVYVLGVANRRFIHTRHPRGDRIASGHSVGHARRFERGDGAL
jgi:hypothetical protein